MPIIAYLSIDCRLFAAKEHGLRIMLIRKIFLLIALYGLYTPCFATTGNQLKDYALENEHFEKGRRASPFKAGLFIGYVEGVVASLVKNELVCAPKGVTLEQSIGVINKYIDTHPELLHLQAASIIEKALLLSPCSFAANNLQSIDK